MAKANRDSKDPKIRILSIEDFMISNDFLFGVTKGDFWRNNTKPKPGRIYYKLTSTKLISLYYDCSYNQFGRSGKTNLMLVEVAYRDGIEEYKSIDRKLNEFQEERAKHKKSKKLDERIDSLQKVRKQLPKYNSNDAPSSKPYEAYLIDTGYKATDEQSKKYVVFDVETNGLRRVNDDLLSLSIFDPETGICYNRFLPLDLQPLVLTSFINGITDDDLSDSVHMDQKEIDWLMDYFHLKDRVLLSYSGGKGDFDKDFVVNYCKRHDIIGFESLSYHNIKDLAPNTPFGYEGQITKDNLCLLLGIDGVEAIHSGVNDCILEWKLFEKLSANYYFFISNKLYRYSPEYIIPCSYLINNPDIARYAGIKHTYVQGTATEIYTIRFPKKILREIEKFPTNITGISLEHGINSAIHAEHQYNIQFLTKNKANLEYVGALNNVMEEIPITLGDNGSINAVKSTDNGFIEEVNRVTSVILDNITPLINYVKDTIFVHGKVLSQELCFSDDNKVFALCDLSDEESIMEIKTYKVLQDDQILLDEVAQQLYYQSKGRKIYILSIEFETHSEKYSLLPKIDNLTIHLYRVELNQTDPVNVVRSYTLNEFEIKILKLIHDCPSLTKAKLSSNTGYTFKKISKAVTILERFKYIKKENPSYTKSPWILLRDTCDIKTKYTCDGEVITII